MYTSIFQRKILLLCISRFKKGLLDILLFINLFDKTIITTTQTCTEQNASGDNRNGAQVIVSSYSHRSIYMNKLNEQNYATMTS